MSLSKEILNNLYEEEKENIEKEDKKLSKEERDIEKRIQNGEIKIHYAEDEPEFVEVADTTWHRFPAGNEKLYRQWVEDRNSGKIK